MATKTRRGSTTVDRELPTRDDALLSQDEVAEMLGVKRRWVERAVGRGDIPHVKVGKLVRIRRSAVLAYIDAQSKVGW